MRKYQSKILQKNHHAQWKFVVEKRDAETLIPLIKAKILAGIDITSDEWGTYNIYACLVGCTRNTDEHMYVCMHNTCVYTYAQ